MTPEPAAALVQLAGQLVKDVGFPIFVAVYLLVKVNPALAKLTAAIHSLSDVMQVAAHLTRRTGDPKP